MKDKVSIIVPSWNKKEFLQLVIEAVVKNTKWPYELVIVDNGSNDGTKEYLENLDLKVDGQVIYNEENLGFAKANNQGVKIAKGNFICFLNNDTMPTKGWLTAMMKVFSEEKACGCVGCLNPKTTLITKKGRKPINEIKIGDLVLTHKNRFRKVTRTFKRKYQGQWTELKVEGSVKVIRATNEHPILIFKNNKLKWIEIGKVKEQDKVLVYASSCSVCSNPIPYWKKTCKYCNSAEMKETKKKLKAYGKTRRKPKKPKGSNFHLKHFKDDILPEIKKWKQKGYRIIPTSDFTLIPDFIAIKNNKVIAVEVEKSKKPNYKKYSKQKYFDKVTWILKRKKKPKIITPLKDFVPISIKKIRRYHSVFRTKNYREVYNCAVEEDESYVAGETKAVLHNCKLLHPGKETIQHAGIIEKKDGRPDHIYFDKPANFSPANKRRRYFGVTGACMVTPKALFNELGMFDEEYWCMNKERFIVVKNDSDNIKIVKISDFYDEVDGKEIEKGVKFPNKKWYTLVPDENIDNIDFLKYILTDKQFNIYTKRYIQNKGWKVINNELGLNQSAHRIFSNGFNKNYNLFPGKWEEIKFIKKGKTKEKQILISDKFGQVKVTENHLISCMDGDKKAKFFNKPNKQKVIVTIPRSRIIKGSIDEAIIVGAYCSEGSICKKNSNQISIASYDKKWLDMISRSIKQKFPDVVPKYRKYKKKKIVGIRLNNNKSILPFLKKCGIGCENKRIPDKFFNSDKKTITKLIEILVQGDGHIVKRKVKDTIMYTSKSTELTAGISLLLKIIGIQHSIYFNEHKRVFNIKTIQSFSTKQTAGIKKEYSNSKNEYVYDVGVRKEHCFADALGLKVIHNCGWEDMDLMQKLRLRGQRVFYEPKSVVYHYESRTEGRYSQEGHNFNLYIQKWILKKEGEYNG